MHYLGFGWRLLESFGSKLGVPRSVLLAEAVAVREACIFCSKTGLLNVCIDTDSLEVVSWCLEMDGIPLWEIAAVTYDIWELAANCSLSISAG